MENATWVEIVEANVRKHGDLVFGIDPSLPDLPQFFEQEDGNWIDRYVNFILDAVEKDVGFVKFQIVSPI